MSRQEKRSRNAISFNKFRLITLTAFREIRSLFTSPTSTAPLDAQLMAFRLEELLAAGEWADAVALAGTLSEQQYGDATSYRRGAQLVALVKKVPYRHPDLDPEGNALRKFLEAEGTCKATNEVLRDLRVYLDGKHSSRALAPEDDAMSIIKAVARAQGHLRRVLGDKPPMRRIWDLCRFGTGSSVGVHGAATHLLRKLSSETWTCSTTAASYARAAMKCCASVWDVLGLHPRGLPQLYLDQDCYTREWCDRTAPPYYGPADFDEKFNERLVLCDADLITYVPKQADSHRTVGTQPLLNMFLQLGVGDYLRDEVLLRRCGVDLRRDQERVNGKLALLGSACEGLPMSTIDLSSASDCISVELCRLLLPPEWFDMLNSIRTPSYMLPDSEEPVRYEKFCAMGNGFCFPLETMIFWSLVQAVYDEVVIPDRTCAVYGDDIIVYQSAALFLIELLDAVGFSTNTSKTFVYGPFRESCGQDYFDGIYVRPVVVDKVFDHESQAYHFVNSLQRKGWTSLAELLRSEFFGPDAFKRPFPGDTATALEVPWDEFMASRHAYYPPVPREERVPWYSSWSWLEFITTAIKDDNDYGDTALLAAALSGAESVKGIPQFSFRRKTEVRVRRVAHG